VEDEHVLVVAVVFAVFVDVAEVVVVKVADTSLGWV
jgi:hypothetical protein